MTRSIGKPVVDFDFSVVSFVPSGGSKSFLDSHHYAGYGRAATVSYVAVLDDEVIGECKFASLVRQRVASSSGFRDSASLELDRFCVRPGYHKKNFSSFMMSACIRLVRRDFPGLEALISFADPRFGHSGGLYRASNWTFVGRTGKSYFYVDEDGVELNKKAVYSRARASGLKESDHVMRLGLRKVLTPRKLKFVYPLSKR
jgi:GNAT superfamily N-acetyltransferase